MGMQVPDNSLNHLQLYCEIYLTNQLPPSELNALHDPNPLDAFDLSDRNNPVDLGLEQQKDFNFCTVLEWLEKGPSPLSPYISNEQSKYFKHFDR